MNRYKVYILKKKNKIKTYLSDLKKRKHKMKGEIEIDIVDENNKNNGTCIVSSCFCGKAYLMMNKILSTGYNNPETELKIPSSFLFENTNYDTKEEVSAIDEYKDCVVVFDDMLEKKQNQYFLFLPAVDKENIEVCSLWQRFFELLLLLRDESNFTNLFNQFPKTVQILFKNISAFDMSYNENK